MMAAINTLFILVLCVIGFGVYCLLAIPFWLVTADRILPRKRRYNRLTVGLLVVPVSYLLLLFAGYTWATRPAAVFDMAFGFKPPADVEFDSSDHYVLGDYGEQSLSFSAAPSTIERILKTRFDTSLKDSKPNADGSFSFSREFSDSFAFEMEDLQYRQNTMKARYHWVGID